MYIMILIFYLLIPLIILLGAAVRDYQTGYVEIFFWLGLPIYATIINGLNLSWTIFNPGVVGFLESVLFTLIYYFLFYLGYKFFVAILNKLRPNKQTWLGSADNSILIGIMLLLGYLSIPIFFLAMGYYLLDKKTGLLLNETLPYDVFVPYIFLSYLTVVGFWFLFFITFNSEAFLACCGC